MDKKQVNIVKTERLQALVQAQLNTGIVRRPDFGHDEDILSLDTRRKGLLETLANSLLIAVAVGGVDEPVAALQSVGDGILDFLRLALPGA